MKIKEIKTMSKNRKARIKISDLIYKVKEKINKEKIDALIAILETKYRELEQAKIITTKLETHNMIHYGTTNILLTETVERKPGDTRLW